MKESPYHPPKQADASPKKKRAPAYSTWHPLNWAVIGFAGGTLLVAPFILSLDSVEQLRGGAMFGGPLGAFCGLAHGAERRRNERRNRGEWD